MTLIPRSPAPRKFTTASLITVGLLAFSVAGLLAQSTPYSPILERQLWKELLPWGLNTGANNEIIWANRKDLNNIPSSSKISTGQVDAYGDVIYRSVTPYGSTPESSLVAANIEFGLLGAIGECTYSHAADYDIDYSIYFPQVRLCKGPQFPPGSGVYAKLPPAPGRLLNPVGIAISGKKVFVTDLFNHRVEAFDFFGNNIPMKYPIGNGIPGVGFYNYDVTYPGLNYRPYASVPGFAAFDGGYSGHQLSAPAGIAADARRVLGQDSPRLLIADSDNYRLALFNDDGSVAFGTQASPVHVVLPVPADSQGVPVLNPVNNPFKPDLVAISAGAVIRAPGTVIDPGDPDYFKRVVVADRVHCYVAIMDVGFNVIKTLPPALPQDTQHDACQDAGLSPTLPGEFTTITGVKVDQSGTIYVADHANNAVRVFDRSGNLATTIGQPGGTNPGGSGDLRGPVGVFIDEQFGRLGVIDEGNARAVFYGIAGGPAAVTYEFQIDTTVAVDDFPMGVAMQFGAEADGLDPKGRIMVTDPIRRRVLRWELPELVIANASATITNSSAAPKLGIGSFDVVVPYQKLSAVLAVIVDIQPTLPGSVSVVSGSVVPSLASRPNIQFGQLVHYTFQFESTIAEAKFDITARGDCDAGGANCLAVAPDAAALARALCSACAATHEVYYDQPLDPQNPVLAALVDTPDKIESGRTITGWYNRPVFVRIHPVVPAGILDNDPNRVVRIAWSYGGIGGQYYGTSVTESAAFNVGDNVDAVVRVSGATWLTYQAITAAGSASAPVEVLLPVDFRVPTMQFTGWTPSPTGNDGTLNWYNVPVTGIYRVLDEDSGPQAAPNGGQLQFNAEGRNQFTTFPLFDVVGNTEDATSNDTGRGGRVVNIDMTAPDFVNGLGQVINDSNDGLEFTVPFTGFDNNGLYANLPAGALSISAADPLLSNGQLGSRPGAFVAGNLATSAQRDGAQITFRATDHAGNFRERTATIRLRQAAPSVSYIGDVSVVYGSTLMLKAVVTPSYATGTITFTIDGRTVTGTLIDEVTPSGVRRVAIALLPRVLSAVTGGPVPPYVVQVDYSGDQTLTPASTTGEVRVLKFPVHVTALPQSKISGEVDPALAYTSVPAVEDLFLATDAFVGRIERVSPQDNTVGVYEIQKYALALNNPNYDLIFHEAVFKVLGVVPVTAVAQSIVYGSAPAPFTYTYGVFPPGTSLANVVTAPVCDVAGAPTQAGTYAIECDNAVGQVLDQAGQPILDQYGSPLLTFSYNTAPLVIRRAVSVASVVGGVFTYNGQPQSASACTINGVNGEILPGTLSYSPGPNAPVNVGSVVATCAFAGDNNYQPSSAMATITINKATPVVSLIGGPFTYDGTPHPGTCSVAGVAGQTLTGAITYAAGSAPLNATPGAAATCSFAGDANYNPARANYSIVVNPRPITITAQAKTKVVGAQDPALTYTITAGSLVAGDALTGSLSRAAGELVGAYPINQGTLAAGRNYIVTYVPANLTITANVPPVAVDDAATTSGVAPVTLAVLGNDSDPDGGTLTVTGTAQPTGGAAVGIVTRVGNQVTFTPTAGFTGTAVFTYTISDGQGGTATATVRVVVGSDNRPPTVSAPNRTDLRGSTATGQIIGSDPDGDPITYSATGLPPGATLSSTGVIGGVLTTSGVYTVTVTVKDPSNATGTGTFIWTVNTPPVALDDAASTNKGAPVTIAVLGNDSDADGNTLTVSGVTQPTGGAAVGVVTTLGNQVVFTPAVGFVGTAVFTYTISDGQGGTATATVRVTVINRPPTVSAPNRTDLRGATATGQIIGSDPDGDPITYSATGLPPGATLSSTGVIGGVLTTSGVYTVTVTVKDPSNATGSGTFTWTVLTPNVPPTATNDSATSVGAAPVIITVLTNDADPDGGTLALTAITQPSGGAAVGVVTTSGNQVVFTPAVGFVGTAVFTYTISDGQGGTATATVTVTITAPVCTTGGYLTYSQGGWGNGGAPGQLLAAKFAQVYPSGSVTIGGTKTMKFTSASAIEAFLPANGKPAVMGASAVNPASSSAGSFAGQLLALRLAVDFSAAGVTKGGLGELVLVSGPFAGSSVKQVLVVANAVIGGQTSALPSGMTISQLSSILESLNMNYHEGTVNKGLLRCPTR